MRAHTQQAATEGEGRERMKAEAARKRKKDRVGSLGETIPKNRLDIKKKNG
jgi:hypothetical protein